MDDDDLDDDEEYRDRRKRHSSPESGVTTDEEVRGLAPLIAPETLAKALPVGSYRQGHWRAAGSWHRPDGSRMPVEQSKAALRTFIEDTCEFTPDTTLVMYLLHHILAPHLQHDELLRYVAHVLEPDPDGLTDVTELWMQWKKLPVVKTKVEGKVRRSFQASKEKFRDMLAERGFNLDDDILVGYKLKGAA